MRDFEALPHTADLKIRVYGASLFELFSNALIGMFQSIEPVVPQCTIVDDRVQCDTLPAHYTISLSAPELDLLLIDFLSEALYLSDVHNEAYLGVEIHSLNEYAIHATVKGVPVKRFGIEIKAVTYHDLHIQKTSDGYQVDIVFDI